MHYSNYVARVYHFYTFHAFDFPIGEVLKETVIPSDLSTCRLLVYKTHVACAGRPCLRMLAQLQLRVVVQMATGMILMTMLFGGPTPIGMMAGKGGKGGKGGKRRKAGNGPTIAGKGRIQLGIYLPDVSKVTRRSALLRGAGVGTIASVVART